MRTRTLLSMLLVLAASAPAISHAGPTPGPGYLRYDTRLAMSDGVRIEASLYLPDPAGAPVPLIVRQHGGGSTKDNAYDVGYGLEAVRTGRFALLMYSARGHGGSDGLFDFFGERTTRDFSELVDWADEKFDLVDVSLGLGVWGYSQGGGESLLPAIADPRVTAVAVGNTFDSLDRALNPNDCFKLSFATGIFALAYKSAAAKTDDATALRWGAQWYTDTEDVALPNFGSTTADVRSRSPETHAAGTPNTIYARGLHVPLFWSNSWEDALFPADHGDRILAGLEQRGIPTHRWFASGGHEAGANDPADERGKEQAMLHWFEEMILGVDHGYRSGATPKVTYAQRVPGSAAWMRKTAESWPIAGEHVLPLGEATIVYAPSANLATEPILSNRAGPLVSHVPDGPVGAATATFATAPLGSPLEATGAPRVRIDYTTTATRVAQFAVKVWDEHPLGTRSMVWRGCMSDETPQDGRAEFDLWPNTRVFPAGHRIVVTVSTSDAPTFKPDVEPHVATIAPTSTVTLTGVS